MCIESERQQITLNNLRVKNSCLSFWKRPLQVKGHADSDTDKQQNSHLQSYRFGSMQKSFQVLITSVCVFVLMWSCAGLQ